VDIGDTCSAAARAATAPPSLAAARASPPRADDDNEEPICRFCFEGGGASAPLLSPCACAGSARCVHVACLDRWRAVSRNERAFAECLECLSPYALRPVAGGPPPQGSALWRARAAEFLAREYVPVLLLLQAACCGAGYLLSRAPAGRAAFARWGAPACRLPPAPPGQQQQQQWRDAAAAAVRACEAEFFYVMGFLALGAAALLATAAAAAAPRLRGAARRHRKLRGGGGSSSCAVAIPSFAPPQPPAAPPLAPPPAPTRREAMLSAAMVAVAFIIGGLSLAVFTCSALQLRLLQARAQALRRAALVCAYAVVDRAAESQPQERQQAGAERIVTCGHAHALPPAHCRYLRAAGALPPAPAAPRAR
jgi:hypothetical protein